MYSSTKVPPQVRKIIAITGATGFIGGKLAMRHLAQGDEVRVLSRRSLELSGLPAAVQWFQGDLTGGTSLHAFVDGVDVLYHCAGEIRDKSRMEALHVDGTRRLIEAATDRIGRWVQLSSTGTYGQRRSGTVTESSTLQPSGMYEETKLRSDGLVQAASLRGAFQHVILRPSIVFGEAMPNQSINSMIAMIRKGLFFFIGEQGASANYIHVDNVVEALLLCATSPRAAGQIYNLSDYRTLEEFVACIAVAMECNVPSIRLPEFPIRILVRLFGGMPRMPLTHSRVDALTTRAIYSIEKIQRELDYRHLVPMESGLQAIVKEYTKRNLA